MSRNLQFRRAIARYFDQPLTPEIAAAIEVEAFGQSQPAPLPAYLPHEHNGHVIRVERFTAILEELTPLHEAHWQETEKYRHGLTLNPRYDVLAERERAGSLVQIVARKDGQITGHFRFFLGESVHTSTLFAEEDTLYIRPEYRGGFLWAALLSYAERIAADMGAIELRANSKVTNNAAVLMRRKKYTPTANQFVKFLKETPDVL